MLTPFTEDEIKEYQAKQARKKRREEEQAAEAAEAAAEQAATERRTSLEVDLEAKFRASGGTASEWRRHKERVVTDALVALTLAPDEPEPEKPLAPAPLPKSRYMDRAGG